MFRIKRFTKRKRNYICSQRVLVGGSKPRAKVLMAGLKKSKLQRHNLFKIQVKSRKWIFLGGGAI